jgi:oligopeptide/dipeptide ABC transporter ATP-binding protein
MMVDGDERPLLEVDNLHVSFRSPLRTTFAVNGLTLSVNRGETVALVGESGSGKSVSVLAMLGLLRGNPRAHIDEGEVRFLGEDLIGMSDRRLNSIRGGPIGFVYQNALSALDPIMRIGDQVKETLRAHRQGIRRQEANERAVELLRVVGIPNPERRMEQYPFEFSGGMLQRVMIAIAIANDPVLLVADEPTTALDVTVQAQVLRAINDAKEATGASALLITHDLGVVAEIADRVCVMYGGRIVESGAIADVFARPAHPYTVALLSSLPAMSADSSEPLRAISGSPAELREAPTACTFADRCELRNGRTLCVEQVPLAREVAIGHHSACFFTDELIEVEVRR